MSKKIKNISELSFYEKYFSENKFWELLAKNAAKAGKKVVYLALVLYYVMLSPDVSLKNKSIILGALGYLIFPLDFIPDFIPVAGFADDASALALAYQAVKTSVTPQIEDQAKSKLAQWFS